MQIKTERLRGGKDEDLKSGRQVCEGFVRFLDGGRRVCLICLGGDGEQN